MSAMKTDFKFTLDVHMSTSKYKTYSVYSRELTRRIGCVARGAAYWYGWGGRLNLHEVKVSGAKTRMSAAVALEALMRGRLR